MHTVLRSIIYMLSMLSGIENEVHAKSDLCRVGPQIE